MAVQYYYQVAEAEHGPVSFKELVRLVSDGDVTVNDPVKADWQADWQPAAEVVGLFHMAGRQDVLEIWEAEEREQARLREIAELPTSPAPDDAEQPPQSATDLSLQTECHAQPTPESTGDSSVDDQPSMEADEGWSFSEVFSECAAGLITPEKLPQPGTTFESGQASFHRQESLFADAMREADARLRGRASPTRRSWFSTTWLRRSKSARNISNTKFPTKLVQFGLPLIVANLAVAAVMYWSGLEARRFPRKDEQVTMIFPVRGECSESEYQFWIAGTMLLTGALAFPVARSVASFGRPIDEDSPDSEFTP